MPGLMTRVAQRLLALAAGIGHNYTLWETGQLDKPSRSLIVYWRRLRVGELRILWRAVGDGERRRVARGIHRRDLERAVRTLGD